MNTSATTTSATSTGRPRQARQASSAARYETERDQRLMILLDTGRLMSPRIGSYRKLDYAINAAVHLAQIALHKGDLVGYALFNDELQALRRAAEGPGRRCRTSCGTSPRCSPRDWSPITARSSTTCCAAARAAPSSSASPTSATRTPRARCCRPRCRSCRATCRSSSR
ncbi:MAG: DUF58 domain-containing protein [Verrucomicrobiota bacterium]